MFEKIINKHKIETEEVIEHLNDIEYGITNGSYQLIETIFSVNICHETDDLDFLEALLLEIIRLVSTSKTVVTDESYIFKSSMCYIYANRLDGHDLQRQKKYYNLAIEYNFKATEPNQNLLINCYEHLSDFQAAISVLEKSDLSNKENSYKLAQMYHANHDYNAAITKYLDYLKLDLIKYDYYKVNEQIAWCYLRLDDIPTAQSYFYKANILNNAHIIIEVTRYFEEIERYDLALEYYKVLYEHGEIGILERIEYVQSLIK